MQDLSFENLASSSLQYVVVTLAQLASPGLVCSSNSFGRNGPILNTPMGSNLTNGTCKIY